MKTRSYIAAEKLLAGYNCAQAVLYSFCDDLRFDRDTALRLACGFGAGMARNQGVCGVVTGGIITIGSNTDAARGRIERPQRKRIEKCGNSCFDLSQSTAHATAAHC